MAVKKMPHIISCFYCQYYFTRNTKIYFPEIGLNEPFLLTDNIIMESFIIFFFYHNNIINNIYIYNNNNG